jgi:hypothetical protein
MMARLLPLCSVFLFVLAPLAAPEIDLVLEGSYRRSSYNHVAVQGGYAYVAGPQRLDVLDLSDPQNPSLATTVSGLGYLVQCVAAGDRLYICGPSFSIHDISDPKKPQQLWRGPSIGIGRAEIHGNLAYVAAGSFRIFDVSNPTNAVELSRSLVQGAWDVAVRDGYAFVTGGDRLVVLEVSEPSRPGAAVKTLSCSGADDVLIVEDVAYVACSDGLRAYSLANSAAPALFTKFALPGGSRGVSLAVRGQRIYVVGESSGVHALEWTSMTNLAHVGMLGGYKLNVGLGLMDDGRIVYSTFQSGLHILREQPASVSPLATSGTPAAPIIGAADTPFGTVTLASDAVRAWSAANPERPVVLDRRETPVAARSVGALGNFVVIADQHALTVLKATESGFAHQTVLSNEFGAWGLPATVGNFLYFPSTNQGVIVLSLDDRAQIRQLGHVPLEAPVQQMCADGGVAVASDGKDTLVLLDLSVSESPAVFYRTNYVNGGGSPALESSTLYLANSGKIRALDIKQNSAPVFLGAATVRSVRPAIAVRKGIVYAFHPQEGLEVWDFRDPSAPVRLGGNSSRGVSHLSFAGPWLYAFDSADSVAIYNLNSILPTRFLSPEIEPSQNLVRFPFATPFKGGVYVERSQTLGDWAELPIVLDLQDPFTVQATNRAEFFRLRLSLSLESEGAPHGFSPR